MRGGVDISNLRPFDMEVKNSAGTTLWCGFFYGSFFQYHSSCSARKKGALMMTMDVRHPEILQFIKSKQDLTKVTGANISVKLTNDFMRAVREKQIISITMAS